MRYRLYPSRLRWSGVSRAAGMAQDPALATILNGKEHGFAVYERPDGTLLAGPVSVGTWNAVSIELPDIPGAQLEALFHTHPGGVAVPSSRDMSEARRVKANHVVILQPELGDMRHYRP